MVDRTVAIDTTIISMVIDIIIDIPNNVITNISSINNMVPKDCMLT